MNSLFGQIINATKASKIEELINYLEKQYDIMWRPVGDKECNPGVIDINKDPISGKVERETNGIDSMLELHYQRYAQTPESAKIDSPRKLMEKEFNIKDGRLENVKDEKELRELAKKVSITLRDSDNPSKPTVDFRDRGIGILGRDYPDTILSLNEGRKVKRLHLIGAYGQGGSTAFPTSKYTVIISRRVADNDFLSNVAFTIVRYNPGDVNVDKIGVYEYLVDKKTNLPLEFGVTVAEFESGTLVRHVEMDIGKYSGNITNPSGNSLWFITQLCLFDTVYPVWVEDERSNHDKVGRTVAGSYRRLMNDPNGLVKYFNNSVLDFNAGKVTITWWLLKYEDDPKKRKIINYTHLSTPIIITFNGQKHGDLNNSIIKKELGLPYLDGYLIIHINCDKLDNLSRRELFASTRESVKESSMLEKLKELLIDTLRNDPMLKSYNEDRKMKFMKNTDEGLGERIGNKLKDKLKKMLNIEGEEDDEEGLGEDKTKKQRGKPTPRVLTKITVKDPPTFLTIITPDNKKIYNGKRFEINYKTDADPTYFLEGSKDFNINVKQKDKCRLIGRSKVVDGYGTLYFETGNKNKVGECVEVNLKLNVGNCTLKDEKNLIISVKIEKVKKKNKTKLPKIIILPINSSDNAWQSLNWDEDSVLEIQKTQEEIDIYISLENVSLQSILKTKAKKGQEVEKMITDFYVEHISYYAILIEMGIEKKEFDGLDEEQIGNIKRLAYESAGKSICAIVNDTFEAFVVEAATTGTHDV